MSQIIDGKKISSDIREEIKNEVAQLSNNGIKPGLAVILVGNDSASKVYVNNKKKACEETGIYSEEYLLSEDTTEEELVKLIEELNNRPQINGILLQSPIPKHLDYNKIILHISPFKDVDAFHP